MHRIFETENLVAIHYRFRYHRIVLVDYTPAFIHDTIGLSTIDVILSAFYLNS